MKDVIKICTDISAAKVICTQLFFHPFFHIVVPSCPKLPPNICFQVVKINNPRLYLAGLHIYERFNGKRGQNFVFITKLETSAPEIRGSIPNLKHLPRRYFGHKNIFVPVDEALLGEGVAGFFRERNVGAVLGGGCMEDAQSKKYQNAFSHG